MRRLIGNGLYRLMCWCVGRRLAVSFLYDSQDMSRLVSSEMAPPFFRQSFLQTVGWTTGFKSLARKGYDGLEGPYFAYSYSCSLFLEERLPVGGRVFEYGSGFSALCYARYGLYVTGVVKDKAILDATLRRSANAPFNLEFSQAVKLLHHPNQKNFVEAIHLSVPKTLFDMVSIVDTKDALLCVKEATKALHKTGVIILNNTENDETKAAVAYLLKSNFKALPFQGLAPGTYHTFYTSIFYRPHNCLNL